MSKAKAAGKATEAPAETEPDTLHPRLHHELFGHSAAEATFLGAFQAGALHHAWLLTGEKGIGKATFAYRAARFLLSRSVRESGTEEEPPGLDLPPAHPVSRQIEAGAHSSLFVLGDAESTRSSSSISVDAVRKLRSFMGLTSTNAWRVMIVDPANDLTIASANALLKAIEEPPPRSVFFLISHGAAAVMPTIRSRCVRLSFRPLELPSFERAVLAACRRGKLPAPGRNYIVKLHAACSGSPGRAVEYIAGGLLSLAEKIDRILGTLPKVDYLLVHELIQSVTGAKNPETFSQVCDLIERRIEERAKQTAGASSAPEEAVTWAVLWRSLRERRSELELLNLDKGAFLMSAFSDMETAARTPS